MIVKENSNTSIVIIAVVAMFALFFMFNYPGAKGGDSGLGEVTGNYFENIGGVDHYWEVYNNINPFASSKLKGDGEPINLPLDSEKFRTDLKDNKDHILALPHEDNLEQKYDEWAGGACKSSYGLTKKDVHFCNWTPGARDKTRGAKTVGRYVKIGLGIIPAYIDRYDRNQREPAYADVEVKRLMGPRNANVGFHVFTAPSGGADGVGRWKWKQYCIFKKDTTTKICRVGLDSTTKWVIVARANFGGSAVPYVSAITLFYPPK